MKEGRKARTMITANWSSGAWKTAVFPVEDARGDSRPVPLTYSENEDVLLPEGYRPTKYDVINGRGKKSYNHIANRRFRQLTAMNLKRYLNSKCKVDKTLVVIGIVNSIRKSSPMGGFIKKCNKTGRWISMSDEGAREKVGHCLRDMIASQRDGKAAREASEEQSTGGGSRNRLSPAYVPTATTGQYPSTLTSISDSFKTPGVNKQQQSSSSKRTLVSVPTKKPRKPSTASSRGKSYTAAAVAAATAATITLPSPPPSSNNNHNNNKIHRNSTIISRSPTDLLGPTAHIFPPAMAEIQQIASTFNNFDYLAVSKGNNQQEMSLQQRKILNLLENGYKGSVEELIRTVQ